MEESVILWGLWWQNYHIMALVLSSRLFRARRQSRAEHAGNNTPGTGALGRAVECTQVTSEISQHLQMPFCTQRGGRDRPQWSLAPVKSGNVHYLFPQLKKKKEERQHSLASSNVLKWYQNTQRAWAFNSAAITWGAVAWGKRRDFRSKQNWETQAQTPTVLAWEVTEPLRALVSLSVKEK